VAADLHFSVAVDARGRPVIRVTSDAPVSQPLLSFLVEVDWGQGRLVREYSALLDTPRTVSAPAQPPIQAPVAAPSAVVARRVQPAVAAAPPPAAQAPTPVATPAPAPVAPAPTPAAPPPAPEPVAAAPVVEPLPEPVAAAPAPAAPRELGPVRRGQTLAQVAGQLGSGYTLDQTMLALLRANPEAFHRGNINLLKQGAVLRVPSAAEVAGYSPAEAAAVVREQMDQWREARRPAPQPAAVAEVVAPPAEARATPPAPRATPAAAPRVAQARLEIVPPGKGGQRPGTRSGASAGGEGDMLRQELQQTKEDLAARAAEVDELKARVAELEKLQEQQQQLISLKDSELAAAQQRLADARKAAPAAVATPPAPAPAEEKAAGASMAPWLWSGLGMLMLGLLAWLFLHGRRRATPVPQRRYDTAALAAGMPTAAEVDGDDVADATPEVDSVVLAERAEVEAVPAPPPTWHAAGNGARATRAPVAPEPPAAAGRSANQQIELARAYLDLGDDDAARALLREVLDGRDPAARNEAARMLREL
jgi:pilus assembly protein FimV